MKRCFRLHARGPIPHTDLHIDIVIDDKCRLIPRIPYCGWWGTLRSTDILPIILQPDGKIDFGSEPNDDQIGRFGTCNLHETLIRNGNGFSFSNGERIYNMVIASLSDLAD